jgi:hypothetical protein
MKGDSLENDNVNSEDAIEEDFINSLQKDAF